MLFAITLNNFLILLFWLSSAKKYARVLSARFEMSSSERPPSISSQWASKKLSTAWIRLIFEVIWYSRLEAENFLSLSFVAMSVARSSTRSCSSIYAETKSRASILSTVLPSSFSRGENIDSRVLEQGSEFSGFKRSLISRHCLFSLQFVLLS